MLMAKVGLVLVPPPFKQPFHGNVNKADVRRYTAQTPLQMTVPAV